jgi:hypothetical protein
MDHKLYARSTWQWRADKGIRRLQQMVELAAASC